MRMPVLSLAAKSGLTATISEQSLLLQGHDAVIGMEHDSRLIRFNGVQVWLNEGIRLQGSTWTIHCADWMGTLIPLLQPAPGSASDRPIVLLDPGHGGPDAGAQSDRHMLEKTIALAIANAVRQKLAACQVTAELTRDSDTALSLSNRTEQINSRGATFFVSIHLNHARNPAAVGVETYVLPGPGFPSSSGNGRASAGHTGNAFDHASIFLAYCLQKGIITQTSAPDRGIRRARFDVLKQATCPAALVECGFLSHSDEADRLASPSYQNAIAEGITRGLLTCVTRSGFPDQSAEPSE